MKHNQGEEASAHKLEGGGGGEVGLESGQLPLPPPPPKKNK